MDDKVPKQKKTIDELKAEISQLEAQRDKWNERNQLEEKLAQLKKEEAYNTMAASQKRARKIFAAMGKSGLSLGKKMGKLGFAMAEAQYQYETNQQTAPKFKGKLAKAYDWWENRLTATQREQYLNGQPWTGSPDERRKRLIQFYDNYALSKR